MITNKIKLFLLLTFGFVFLFAQDSFAAQTKIGASDYLTPSGTTPNCAEFNTVPPGVTTHLRAIDKSSDDEMCTITQTDIPYWNKIANIGLAIDKITIPVQFYKKILIEYDGMNRVLLNRTVNNLADWREEIASTPAPIYSDLYSCSDRGKAEGYYSRLQLKGDNNDLDHVFFNDPEPLSKNLSVPQIYNEVKEAILRSCYKGSIETKREHENANLVCAHKQKHGDEKEMGRFTNYYPRNYPSLTFNDFPGCGPLIDSIHFKIKNQSGTADIPLTNNIARINPSGSTGSYQVYMDSSNPSALCVITGKNNGAESNLKDTYCKNNATGKDCLTKIDGGEIPLVNGVGQPINKYFTPTGMLTGIYKYTLTCSGVEEGRKSTQATTTRQTLKVLVGPIPDEPKITSFTIKKADGTDFLPSEMTEICETNNPKTNCKNYPQIRQTDSFRLCWDTKIEKGKENALTTEKGNALINVTASKDGAETKTVNNLKVTATNPNILTACVERTLPYTVMGVSPIGPWNYELEVENSAWSKKGLDSAIKNIIFDVVPIKPEIVTFEVLDFWGNATTSVLTSDKTRLRWVIKNTQKIDINGNNFNSGTLETNSTDMEGYSPTPTNKKEWLEIDESDLASPYTYTLKAYHLFGEGYELQTITPPLQRRQPGQPTISKFEFDKPSVTKKEAGGSGYVNLNWIAGDAKSITIEGPGVPFSATKRLSSGTIAISIDDLSVAPEGLKYTLTACPTLASNPASCSKSEATLKVYSSDAFGATLIVDDSIIRIGNSTKLRWDVASNDKIKSYSITSTSNDVSLTEIPGAGGYLRPSGEIEIKPAIKTTYTLDVFSVNTALMEDFSTSVIVGTTDKDSPVVEFSADKTEINKGEAVVLTWNAQDTKEVSINNNIGIVAKEGSTTVYPEFTTLYILTAKSAQAGVIPDSEKTVQIKIITPGFEGLAKSEKWENPTDLKTQYGLAEEAERLAKLGILDLKVNGVDGPITVKAPANFTLSWNLDKYCLATGSWLSVKTKAGTENVTLKKNGKYTYNLYCPGAGTDSVEITVTGGQGGLLDQLLGGNRNGDGSGNGEGGGGPMPIAEIAVSTDKIVFSTDVRVIKGKEVELFIRADKDISGDGKASRDQNGEWGALLSNGGGCLYNTKLTKDLQFDGGVESPKSAQDCNASLGKFTFNDEPGTYQYGVFKLIQNDGKFSNIAYITVTVDGPPAPNSAPTMDFRINNKDNAEQTLGTPANYYLTWDVANANTCLATGSWNGAKPPQGIQNFLKSSKSSPVYTLTCENELGITAKTIALKIVESPICKFTALPPIINKQSAFVTESELFWKCDYTDECGLSPSKTNGSIKTYGTMRVSPDQTTNYILTCTNSDISKSFEAKVEIINQ